MTESLRNMLNSISASNVLDVATGTGFFIEVMRDHLKKCDSITGIDQKQFNEKTQPIFLEPGVNYQQMDAEHLLFPDHSFDLVSISNSLHHLPHPQTVLLEMDRVLNPGGKLLIFEMYNDHQTEKQLSHVLLHQWWGKIDTALGVFHDPRFTRAELVNFLQNCLTLDWQTCDIIQEEDDPEDEDFYQSLDSIIESYFAKAAPLVNAAALIDEGKILKERIHSIGFRSATELLAIGTKRMK